MKAKSIFIYLVFCVTTTQAFGQQENLSFYKRSFLPDGKYLDHVERMIVSLKNDTMRSFYSFSTSDGHYHALLEGKLDGSLVTGQKYNYLRDENGELSLYIDEFDFRISSDRKKIIWLSDGVDDIFPDTHKKLPDFEVSKSEYSFSGSTRNFRESPSTSSKIISKVNLNKVNVELIEIGKLEKIGKTYNFWYKIRIDNVVGWTYGGIEMGWIYSSPSHNVSNDIYTSLSVSKESRIPTLLNMNDSINYTLGYWQGDIYRSKYFLDEKDGNLLDVFIKELDKAFNSTPKSEKYELGFNIGEYCNGLKEKGLMENPNIVFNEKWFKKGFNDGLFVSYSLMTPDDANQFVNQTKIQINNGTADYDNISFNEKINYALGIENGKIIKDYHLGEYTKNDEVKELLAGIEAALNKRIYNDDKLQNVSEIGRIIGNQLKSNNDFYNDSTLYVDYKLVRLGLINGITRFKGDFSAESAQNYFNSTMSAREKKRTEEMYKDNKLLGELFLKENAKKKGVVTTSSGLQYEVIDVGFGAKPFATDKIKVNYHGTLVDGTVFDSSVARNQAAEFLLNKVIKGWAEGIQLMSVGSKYKFYIPYELAYGHEQIGDIKPYSTLIFELELLGVERR